MSRRFSPYQNNGGTVLGIAGKDFCVIASDTRQSVGYSINCRVAPKFVQLTDRCVLATSGMNADMTTLHKTLQAKLTVYEHANHKPMTTPAIAQMLSITLYHKRFFPYYCFNVLGGLSEKGEGVVYSYDAVGSFEQVKYSASGTGQMLVIPLLDDQVGGKNQLRLQSTDRTLEETIDLAKDAFATAGERDIYTGDFVDLHIVTVAGVRHEQLKLRFD